MALPCSCRRMGLEPPSPGKAPVQVSWREALAAKRTLRDLQWYRTDEYRMVTGMLQEGGKHSYSHGDLEGFGQ